MVSKLTIEPSRDGNYTACIGSNYLHSKYNPRVEANRIGEHLSIGPHIKAVILINPGLEYLEDLLSSHYRVYCIHSYLLPRQSKSNHWTPESKIGLDEFVFSISSLFSLKEVFVYAWLPGINADQLAAQKLQMDIKNLILSASSFADTTRYFRKSWIRNTVKNVFLTRLHSASGACSSLELCASGPSLEDSLPFLTRSHPNRFIVSSCLNFFEDRGLDFSSVIHADGGFWSLPFFSRPLDKPLFFGLRSRIRPEQSSKAIFVPFSTSPLEELVFGLLYDDHVLKLTDQGTVSLIALEFASIVCKEPVRVFGFDMASKDLLSHARPHPNQLREEINSSRLDPWYSRLARMWLESEPELVKKPWYSNYQLRIFKDKLPPRFVDKNYWFNSPHFVNTISKLPFETTTNSTLQYAILPQKKSDLRLRELKQKIIESPLCKLSSDDLLFEKTTDFVDALITNMGNYVT